MENNFMLSQKQTQFKKKKDWLQNAKEAYPLIELFEFLDTIYWKKHIF